DLDERQRKRRQPEPRTIRRERPASGLCEPARRRAGASESNEAVAARQHGRRGALQALAGRKPRFIVTGSKGTSTVEQFADARPNLLRTVSRQVVLEGPPHFVRDQIDVPIQLLFELPFELRDLGILVLRGHVDSTRLHAIDEPIECLTRRAVGLGPPACEQSNQFSWLTRRNRLLLGAAQRSIPRAGSSD